MAPRAARSVPQRLAGKRAPDGAPGGLPKRRPEDDGRCRLEPATPAGLPIAGPTAGIGQHRRGFVGLARRFISWSLAGRRGVDSAPLIRRMGGAPEDGAPPT